MNDNSQEMLNKAELWGDMGTFAIYPEQPPADTDIPDFLQGQHIFKMYITCSVTAQLADYTPVRFDAMVGLDTSAIPLTVDEGVTLARKTWRDLYNGFGDEIKTIIYQPRPDAEPVGKQLEKALTVARVLWGRIFGK